MGNRQDAIEAVEIAASGVVKCHYEMRKVVDIAKYVVYHPIGRFLLINVAFLPSIYEEITEGKIAHRIVLFIMD